MKFTRKLQIGVALLMLVASGMTARADTEVLSVIVVEKDGTTTSTPISQTAKIALGATDVTVLSKDGSGKSYDYSQIARIDIKDDRITLDKIAIAPDAKLAVWPSPATVTLNVAGTEAGDRISIFGIDGECKIQTKGESERTVINVSSLASGVYVLVAGETSVKFIKK